MNYWLEIFLFLVFIFVLIKHRQRYWKRLGVPYIKPTFFFGNTLGVDVRFHHTIFWRKMYNQLKTMGPIGGFYVFTEPMAMVTDLDLIRTICIKDFEYFPNRGLYINERDDPISAHLASLENDKWKNDRTKITKIFTSGRLRTIFSTVVPMADLFVETIEKEKNHVELTDVTARFLGDVLGKIVFGLELKALEEQDRTFPDIVELIMKNVSFRKKTIVEMHSKFFNFIRLVGTNKNATSFLRDMLKQNVEYRKNNPQVMNDVLEHMLNTELDFNDIFAHSSVMFVAGLDNLVSTIKNCVYELSKNEDYQTKARHCVLDAMDKTKGELTYETLNEMQYLDQCINETLRRYLLSINGRRMVHKNYKVPNTKIVLEKGTIVQIPIYAIHHDPDIYPDPERFDPERFTPEEVEKRHKYAFIPFGAGQHTCIGMRLTSLICKVALAKVLINFEFKLDDRTPTSLKFKPRQLTPTPVGDGIFVNFKRI